jgi:hypothetical protein
MGAGADLDRVLRVDAQTADGPDSLSLPRDTSALREIVEAEDVALIILDPLMATFSGRTDTHKDAEVRAALAPLVRLAEDCGASVLGLIHVNKGNDADPLTRIMGSRAFSALARAVLFAVADPDDETRSRFLLGNPKNNLGRCNLPSFVYRIGSVTVAETDEGPVSTAKVIWDGEESRSVYELMADTNADSRSATQKAKAAEWIRDFLTSRGGTAVAQEVKREGKLAGHAIRTIERATEGAGVVVESVGYPKVTYWRLPPGLAGSAKGT